MLESQTGSGKSKQMWRETVYRGVSCCERIAHTLHDEVKDDFRYIARSLSPKTASLFATLIARAVRSKKYVDCANWDKSVKLGT